MTRLHPDAQALIDAANRDEAPLRVDAFERVHRAVLHRATFLGAVLTAAKVATTGIRRFPSAMGLGAQAVSFGVIGAAVGVVLLTAQPMWSPERQPNGSVSVDRVPRIPDEPTNRNVRTDASEKRVPPVAERPPAGDTTSHGGSIDSAPLTAGPERSTARSRAGTAGTAPEQLLEKSGVSPQATKQVAPRLSGGSAVGPANTSLPESKLAVELALLHRAYAALGGGRPEAALEALDSNESPWGNGALEEEARSARISALCKLGRDTEANAAIYQFLILWPHSVVSERMRHGCLALVGATGNSNAH